MAIVFSDADADGYCRQHQPDNPDYSINYIATIHTGTSLSLDLEASLHAKVT